MNLSNENNVLIEILTCAEMTLISGCAYTPDISVPINSTSSSISTGLLQLAN